MSNLPMRYRGVVVLLLALCCLLAWWSLGSSPQAAEAAADLDFGRQVLEEINARRLEAGAGPVTESPSLVQAAQAHAEYLVVNAFRWDSGSFSAHTEVSTYAGYTGAKASDRAKVAGFPHSGVLEDVLRTRNASMSDVQFIVRCWVDAPLHRKAVLDGTINQMGFGWSNDGINHAYVLNSGLDWETTSQWSGVQSYPGDRQVDIPLGWDGNENPQPFPASVFPHLWSGGVFVGGYPITLIANNGILSNVSLILRTDEGVRVPVSQSNSYPYVFAPDTRLEPGKTYRGTYTYTMAKTLMNSLTGQVVSGELEFQFTTVGGGSTTTGSTTATTMLSTTTTTTGTTTTTAGTTSSTTTTTLQPSVFFTDVPADHPYRAAITSLAARGVVCGTDSGGSRYFKPDDPVIRQQLAKMIVLSLGLSVGLGDECPFEDVEKSEGNELYPDHYVAVAARERIVKGTLLDPPRFDPYAFVTRAQLLTRVVRAGRAVGGYMLVPPPVDWSAGLLRVVDAAHGENIRWAEYNGLLDGIPLYQWDVWAPASRGEVAQVLWALVR